MADQLYLSYRLHNYNALSMLLYYDKMLRAFPFSKLTEAQFTLKITPLTWAEPPVLEQPFNQPFEPERVLDAAKEFDITDCAVQVDAWWDLWQLNEEKEDWEVAPSRIALMCFGPNFEDEEDDHLRVDFGLDENFLPQPDIPNSVRIVESNIKSLLRLTSDLDRVLKPESRRLWTESGENFAERILAALPSGPMPLT